MDRYWSAPSAPLLARDRVARIGDVVIALGLILFTGPLMALVCLAIKLESDGPIFYKIPRLDAGGRPFSLIQFRTTLHDSQAIAGVSDRETRIGPFLRFTRIDG